MRDLIDGVIVKNQVAGALERVTSASKAAAAPTRKAPPTKKASGKRSVHANASR